ncbi:MAG: molybdopterin-binding protein [Phascolarctobacterium sp.]|nr:molybdopterin-binding protein [Phascolarctobacterium sp.]
MSYTACIITVSDKGSRGERVDTAGPALGKILKEAGYDILYTNIVPDEFDQIKAELLKCTDDIKANLVLTTGGTGFSPRDITPEVTKSIIERETPGIAELMRAESMKITLHGCLSRSVAGIRKRTLIVNLPGSEKGARENLEAVLKPLEHGIKMLLSEGSAECAAQAELASKKSLSDERRTKIIEELPSMDAWLAEAKRDANAELCGMYLFHTGVVRETAKTTVREGKDADKVTGMEFSYDAQKVEQAVINAKKLPGIYYARVWLAQGRLNVGDQIMLALVGGDIRPHVIDALQSFVGEIKTKCVIEKEIF